MESTRWARLGFSSGAPPVISMVSKLLLLAYAITASAVSYYLKITRNGAGYMVSVMIEAAEAAKR